MQWTSNVAVVIPCLNESAAIGSLTHSVRQIIPDVIVVDDGSTDATADLAAKAGAEVLRHESPKGKGAALNTGWLRAHERGFAWALAMDGDGQHLASDIPNFLSAITELRCDLVVGNRFGNPKENLPNSSAHIEPLKCMVRQSSSLAPRGTSGERAGERGNLLSASHQKMPWLRRKVNNWMSRRLSRAAGIALPDSQCGFRLMRLGAWANLQLKAEHYEIESEVLLAFAARGYAVRFVPIQTVYAGEHSKIHPVKDTLRWFRWWRRTMAISRQPVRICTPRPHWEPSARS